MCLGYISKQIFRLKEAIVSLRNSPSLKRGICEEEQPAINRMKGGCFNPLVRFKRAEQQQLQLLHKLPWAPDEDKPELGLQFAQFAGGCFWGLELAFQRIPGVIKTEVGYSQGHLHAPTYRDVSDGVSGHAEVVRIVYDPAVVSYAALLDVFWRMHDPTSLNRQGNDVGTQYRSGIYFYSRENEEEARKSMMELQKRLEAQIVTEVLPARKFYRAEAFHQQYLSSGGRFGFKQSAAKRCTDRIRPYG